MIMIPPQHQHQHHPPPPAPSSHGPSQSHHPRRHQHRRHHHQHKQPQAAKLVPPPPPPPASTFFAERGGPGEVGSGGGGGGAEATSVWVRTSALYASLNLPPSVILNTPSGNNNRSSSPVPFRSNNNRSSSPVPFRSNNPRSSSPVPFRSNNPRSSSPVPFRSNNHRSSSPVPFRGRAPSPPIPSSSTSRGRATSRAQSPIPTRSASPAPNCGRVRNGTGQHVQCHEGDWGWTRGMLLDAASNSPTSTHSRGSAATAGGHAEDSSGITVQVRDKSCPHNGMTAVLPGDSLRSGDVVLANLYSSTSDNGGGVKGRDKKGARRAGGRHKGRGYSGGASEENGKEGGGDSVTYPDDLITLTHLHEPAVVFCLRERYKLDRIYTATGPVLLALNPFKSCRGLYSEGMMRKFWEKAEMMSSGGVGVAGVAVGRNRGRSGLKETRGGGGGGGAGGKKDKKAQEAEEELPPHVYGIADTSFRTMLRHLDENRGEKNVENGGKSNQSILVSGESGAGKTVTTKFIMKYLAALSQRSGMQRAKKRQLREERQQQGGRGGGGGKDTALQNNKKNSSSSRTPSRSVSPGKPKNQPSWVVTFHSTSRESDLDVDGTNSSLKSNTIESQVLQSNPILESFGNARTIRNDNSSRFGKFIEIQFTNGGKLVGANIETYLLEKVRLITQSAGERNYHAFYELLCGLDKRESKMLYLHQLSPADFRMTASGTYDRRDGIKDRDTYKNLRVAMDTMGFNVEEQGDIFTVTAALLHAGNMTFCELDVDSSEIDVRNGHLKPVCKLLGVTPEDLNSALCHCSIRAGRDQRVRRSLSKAKAEKGIEALIKATYGAMFGYLVRRINDSIAHRDEKRHDDNDGVGENVEEEDGDSGSGYGSRRENERPAASIGVLDIFGFESFTTNSFEQLCINYCNEALQQQFNAFVLKNEQEEYEREGIEWSFISFPENQDVLDLIDSGSGNTKQRGIVGGVGGGMGILNILDDQCRAPGTTDRTFASDVYAKCTGHPRFGATHRQVSNRMFEVQHYAGPVEYTTEGFVEKNRDEMPKEATELLLGSTNPFVHYLAESLTSETTMSTAAGATTTMPLSPTDSFSSADTPDTINSNVNRFRRSASSMSASSRAAITVGGQFSRQLRHLRSKIDRTSPHYIRCLKPNDKLVPDLFDAVLITEQLRCGGILEAVRVSRAGYTQHYPHGEFVRRYKIVAGRELGMRDRVRNWARNNNGGSGGGGGGGGTTPTAAGGRNGRGNVAPWAAAGGRGRGGGGSRTNDDETSSTTSSSAREECEELVKIIYKMMRAMEEEEEAATAAASASTGDEEQQQQEHQWGYSPYLSSPKASSLSSHQGGAAGGTLWSGHVRSTQVTTVNRTVSSSSSPYKPSSPRHIATTQPIPSPSVRGKNWGGGGGGGGRYADDGRIGGGSGTATTPPRPSSLSVGGQKSFSRSSSFNSPSKKLVPTQSDLAHVGIQMGKTKVFLRHRAFDTLERIRSRKHAVAATVINSWVRMYLARRAYLPVRDAYREACFREQELSMMDEEERARRLMEYELRDAAAASVEGGGGSPNGANDGSVFGNENATHLIRRFESPGGHSYGGEMVSIATFHKWKRSVKTFKWQFVDGRWVKNEVDDGGVEVAEYEEEEEVIMDGGVGKQ